MDTIRQAIKRAGVLTHGHFVFADGDHAMVKLEMDKLWEHPKELDVVANALAEAKDLPPADIVIGVPTGGQRLAVKTGLPMAYLERVPGGAKQDFRFVSVRDETLARGAKSVRIYEDVVTTLSSVAGVVKLLEPSRQDIHLLAIWRRGETKPKYAQGVTCHYLVEEMFPSFPPDQCPVCNPTLQSSRSRPPRT